MAQDDPAGQAPAAPDAMNIVVVGVRALNQRALRIKSGSDQIIDTVSASDIGQ